MAAPPDSRSLTALSVTLILWASAFAGIRAALGAYGPGELALLRFLVASAVLALYALGTRMPLPRRRDLPGLAAAGLVGITGYHLLLNYGERTVTAGAASLLIASVPIFTALLATALLGERLRPMGWLGITVSFGGVALIGLGEGEGLGFDPGTGLIVLSALASAIFFVLQKPYLKRYRPVEVTAVAIWAGTLGMFPYAPSLLRQLPQAPPTTTLAVVYLGIFPAALAYFTWSYALARLPAAVTASFLYCSPVLAIGIAWVWLGEVPSRLSLLGGLLAVGGVVLVGGGGSTRHRKE